MNTKIRKLVYGGLIGDAMGIQFEFFKSKLCNVDNLTYQKSHFLPIDAGCWSDDGDSLLMLLKQMKESDNDLLEYMVYAKNKKQWVFTGIQELGQKTGVGCGNTVLRVVTDPCFDTDPHTASKNVYDKYKSEANGAIMSIAILGLSSNNCDIVVDNILNISKVTHYGIVSQISCLVIGLLVYYINNTNINVYDLYNINQLINMVVIKAIKITKPSKSEVCEVMKYVIVNDINDLILDEEFKMGYCLKTMGCVLWALKNINMGFVKLLTTIYKQGGDTDTNGCVVGAVIGPLSEIPSEWIDGLKYNQYVEKLLNIQQRVKD